MKCKRILSLCLAGALALTALTGCVNQHPEDTASVDAQTVRLVATSPAVAEICDRLELDLVGVCETSSSLPQRYADVTTVGMP